MSDRLPTLTLPIQPGEPPALFQLPRHVTPKEWAYLKHLLDVMSGGFVFPTLPDEETEPVVEHFAASRDEGREAL